MQAPKPTRRSWLRRLLVGIPLTVVALVLVVAFTLWVGMFRFMHPVDTGPIDDRCTALLSSANWFVYARGGTTIAIDTGTSLDRATQGMQSTGIDAGKVSAVFLTHPDEDHAGGAAAFPRAVFYMGEGERDLLSGKTSRVFFGIRARTTFNHQWTPVSDGLVTTVGPVSVLAIHVPGHTPGSMAFLVDGTHLFTGDLMVLKDGRAVMSPSAINNDNAEAERSLHALARRVSGTGVKVLATAHGGVSRDPDAALAAWR